MDPLPMVPASCALNNVQLQEQIARHRAAGQGAVTLERGRRKLVILVSGQVPDEVVEQLVAVERDCCPFFHVDWSASERRLAIAVPDAGDEPALDAIASVLALTA
jgi:hypothetical protein